jgi:hypothetical protein
MSGILVFDADEVRRVIDHSVKAPEQRKMLVGWDMVADKATYQDVPTPAIVLVHDDGVYLMSNGEPRDLVEGDRSFVAHAKGTKPGTRPDWWEQSRELVGGDDFAETLTWTKAIQDQLDGGAKRIRIEATPEELTLLSPER